MGKKRPQLFSTIELTKAAMFIALMAIGANLTAFLTIGAVPLTFQTGVAILAGIILGKKTGVISMIGYVIVGLIGVPVFANFQGGIQALTLPTFGFIISFIFIAFIVAIVFENKKGQSLMKYAFASYIGLITNYIIGIPYLYLYMKHVAGTLDITILATTMSMTPFLIKDILLSTFIVFISPKIVKALHYSKLLTMK